MTQQLDFTFGAWSKVGVAALRACHDVPISIREKDGLAQPCPCGKQGMSGLGGRHSAVESGNLRWAQQRQAVGGCFEVIQQNDVAGGKLRGQGGSVHSPRQVCRLYAMVDDRACHPQTPSFNPSPLNPFSDTVNIAQEFRDDRVKGGKLAAFVPAFGNLLIFLSADFVQGEIALGAADIPGEDHLLLPGFARIVPAGFPRCEPADCGLAGSSNAAAASSTRNSFKPLSRGWTCCAGYGGSAFPSSTARSVSAFSAPTTRKTTRSAASSTGKVNVMRRALSFTTIGVLTHREVCRVTRVPGKSEAVWPSGPIPRRIKWNRGKPRSSSSRWWRRTSS